MPSIFIQGVVALVVSLFTFSNWTSDVCFCTLTVLCMLGFWIPCLQEGVLQITTNMDKWITKRPSSDGCDSDSCAMKNQSKLTEESSDAKASNLLIYQYSVSSVRRYTI
jgi:hypothetical protein